MSGSTGPGCSAVVPADAAARLRRRAISARPKRTLSFNRGFARLRDLPAVPRRGASGRRCNTVDSVQPAGAGVLAKTTGLQRRVHRCEQLAAPIRTDVRPGNDVPPFRCRRDTAGSPLLIVGEACPAEPQGSIDRALCRSRLASPLGPKSTASVRCSCPTRTFNGVVIGRCQPASRQGNIAPGPRGGAVGRAVVAQVEPPTALPR